MKPEEWFGIIGVLVFLIASPFLLWGFIKDVPKMWAESKEKEAKRREKPPGLIEKAVTKATTEVVKVAFVGVSEVVKILWYVGLIIGIGYLLGIGMHLASGH